MKVFQKAKAFAVTGITVAGGFVATSAHAAAGAIDLTSITGAVSASDIATGVLAIGAVMAVAYMTIKATKIVIGVLKSV